MEGIDPSVWAEVERAAGASRVDPAAFAETALAKAAEAALAEVTIYMLVDPRTRVPRYVGRTLNPGQRMKAHRRDKDGSARAAWVSELRAEGLEPTMVPLSTVLAADADWGEQYWIEALKQDGADLLNAHQVCKLPELRLPLAPPLWERMVKVAAATGSRMPWFAERAIWNAVERAERELEFAESMAAGEADHAAC